MNRGEKETELDAGRKGNLRAVDSEFEKIAKLVSEISDEHIVRAEKVEIKKYVSLAR